MSESSDPSASASEVYAAMSTLRAVRRLRADPIPDAVLRRVIQAAIWAPTGGNRQPWRVIAVTEPAAKRRLQELYIGPWEAYAKGHRGLLAALPAEERERDERMLRSADHLAQNLHLAPVIAVFCFDPRRMAITDAGLERPSVVGGGSVYPAVQNFLLACRAEGLGCTLTTLLCLREVDVKELLGIPPEWGTCAHVPIGYPAGKGHGPLRRQPVEKMAFRERWGAAFA
jgi:nitroreductase